MHATTLSAAVKRHGHLASKAAELIEALKADPKGFSEEEIKEIFEAITDPKDGRVPIGEVGDHNVTHVINGIKVPPGKKLYDKWRGSWVAIEQITNPFDGKVKVITWRFDRLETKANKTNIPLTEKEAAYFNQTHQLEESKTPTEQLYLAGDNTPIFNRLPNPFAPQTVG